MNKLSNGRYDYNEKSIYDFLNKEITRRRKEFVKKKKEEFENEVSI